MKFANCHTCRNPFPLFSESGLAAPARCPPCRKRARGEPLSKSDLALDEMHAYYRERADPDRFERLQSELRDARVEIVNLGQELFRARNVETADSLRQKIAVLEANFRASRERLEEAERTIASLRRAIATGMFGSAPTSIPNIDRAFVGQLLKLTHPDRWVSMAPELGALANTVTARLLTLRKELKS